MARPITAGVPRSKYVKAEDGPAMKKRFHRAAHNSKPAVVVEVVKEKKKKQQKQKESLSLQPEEEKEEEAEEVKKERKQREPLSRKELERRAEMRRILRRTVEEPISRSNRHAYQRVSKTGRHRIVAVELSEVTNNASIRVLAPMCNEMQIIVQDMLCRVIDQANSINELRSSDAVGRILKPRYLERVFVDICRTKGGPWIKVLDTYYATVKALGDNKWARHDIKVIQEDNETPDGIERAARRAESSRKARETRMRNIKK